MQIITGRTGKRHVYALDDAEINRMILGDEDYVLPTGNKFECEMVGTTAIKIKDGSLMMQGRLAKIRPQDGADELQFEQNTPGNKRVDVLVAEYRIEEDTSSSEPSVIEIVDTKLLTGVPTVTTDEYSEPAIITGVIDDGETHQMPLYKIYWLGDVLDTTITPNPKPVFNTLSKTKLDEIGAYAEQVLERQKTRVDEAFAYGEKKVDDAKKSYEKLISDNASLDFTEINSFIKYIAAGYDSKWIKNQYKFLQERAKYKDAPVISLSKFTEVKNELAGLNPPADHITVTLSYLTADDLNVVVEVYILADGSVSAGQDGWLWTEGTNSYDALENKKGKIYVVVGKIADVADSVGSATDAGEYQNTRWRWTGSQYVKLTDGSGADSPPLPPGDGYTEQARKFISETGETILAVRYSTGNNNYAIYIYFTSEVILTPENSTGLFEFFKRSGDNGSWMNLDVTSISGIDRLRTFKTVTFDRMFAHQNVDSLDLSHFDTSAATSMAEMFKYSYTTKLDLSNFNTSKVTDMSNMFGACAIGSVDLSSFGMSSVTNTKGMFASCEDLTTIVVGDLWEISASATTNGMFDGTTKLVGGNGTAWNGNHTGGEYAVVDSAEHPGYLTLKVAGCSGNTGSGFSIDKVYPVGSIYTTLSFADPGDLFGGTWVKIEDRFLLAAGKLHNVLNAKGGSSEMTASMMPVHSHSASLNGRTTSQSAGVTTGMSANNSHNHSISNGTKEFACVPIGVTIDEERGGGIDGDKYDYPRTKKGTNWTSAERTSGVSIEHTHQFWHGHDVSVSGETSAAGEGTSENNMPPYLVVNIWQRTA